MALMNPFQPSDDRLGTPLSDGRFPVRETGLSGYNNITSPWARKQLEKNKQHNAELEVARIAEDPDHPLHHLLPSLPETGQRMEWLQWAAQQPAKVLDPPAPTGATETIVESVKTDITGPTGQQTVADERPDGVATWPQTAATPPEDKPPTPTEAGAMPSSPAPAPKPTPELPPGHPDYVAPVVPDQVDQLVENLNPQQATTLANAIEGVSNPTPPAPVVIPPPPAPSTSPVVPDPPKPARKTAAKKAAKTGTPPTPEQ